MVIRPFVTNKFTFYLGDTTKTQLSLAVWVVDGSTVLDGNTEENENIRSGIQVFLKEDKGKIPILNPNGYYCFTDLTPGPYTLIVQPDGSKSAYFFPAEASVDIPIPDPSTPLANFILKELILTPTPSYPFSANATLIRGIVKKESEPVDDAEVNAGYVNDAKDIKTYTDHNGEFVLLLKKIKFKIDNDDQETDSIENILIEIKKGDEIRQTSVEEILQGFIFKEGETANLKIIKFP